MTKNEVIMEVKTAISTMFENMNIIEYDGLCHGTGTLTVLDNVLNDLPSQFRVIDPTVESIIQQFDENDIAELTDYCINVAEKRGQQFTQALRILIPNGFDASDESNERQILINILNDFSDQTQQ